MTANTVRLRRHNRAAPRDENKRNDTPTPAFQKGGTQRFSPLIIFFLGLIAGFILTNFYHSRLLTTSAEQLTLPTTELVEPGSKYESKEGFTPNINSIHFECFITVYSYDRPRHLYNLLQDIVREARVARIKVAVNVIDDNSLGCIFPSVDKNIFDIDGDGSLDLYLVNLGNNRSTSHCSARLRFKHVESFIHANNWNLFVSKYRHGRRRHWHLVRMAHSLLRPVSADKFIFLPDDDRLARGFFTKVFHHWGIVQDPRKLTMMLHIEKTREHTAVWTKYKPRSIGNGIIRIGWVESGNFICTRDFLQFMNWSFPRVPVQRWIDNPPISSGVGATISELIHSSGKRMYRTEQSFVAHVGVSSSKMNAEFREKGTPSLLTEYFADGNDIYEQLLSEAATITASVASYWMREASLQSSVDSLGPQVDHINVYLNDYDQIPPYLMAPHITVKSSRHDPNLKDLGDIGKFHWCNDIDTDFHLTVDDDIIYPRNYTTSLMSFWRQYKAPVVVGVHGIRIKQNELKPVNGRRGKGYYGSREVWMALEDVIDPVVVHIIGTGTLLYRPKDIGYINVSAVFPIPNMADIWFGLLAQRLKLPMIVIPHRGDWIREVPGTFDDSIYKRSTRRRSSDKTQTEAARSIDVWELNAPKAVQSV